MKVLAVDVGGTHVKILVTGENEKREIDSGPSLTALGDGVGRQKAGPRLAV